MTRILVDAPTLIALSKVGRLEILQKISKNVYTTRVVRAETLEGTTPDVSTLEDAFHDGWIKIVPLPRNQLSEPLERYGLGPGEASLFAVTKQNDLLIMDDKNARRFAESRDYTRVGLLGLLVQTVEANRLDATEALETLDRLATSDFRMSIDLYLWTKEKLESCIK